MTIITCTFDDAQFKVVPIIATKKNIQTDYLNQQKNNFKTYSEWKNNHSSNIINKIREYCAKDYRAMIKASPPYPESNFVESLDSWIPVSERFPEIFQKVYAFVPLRDSTRPFSTAIMRYSNSYKSEGYRFLLDGIELEDGLVTHWMPIPSAPKGEE